MGVVCVCSHTYTRIHAHVGGDLDANGKREREREREREKTRLRKGVRKGKETCSRCSRNCKFKASQSETSNVTLPKPLFPPSPRTLRTPPPPPPSSPPTPSPPWYRYHHFYHSTLDTVSQSRYTSPWPVNHHHSRLSRCTPALLNHLPPTPLHHPPVANKSPSPPILASKHSSSSSSSSPSAGGAQKLRKPPTHAPTYRHPLNLVLSWWFLSCVLVVLAKCTTPSPSSPLPKNSRTNSRGVVQDRGDTAEGAVHIRGFSRDFVDLDGESL